MREIKFRAWSKISCEMFTVVMLAFPFGENRVIVSGRGGSTDTENDDCILMQFTGCHDRNGQEIWEGDIVKYFINTGFWTGRDDPPDIDEMTEYIEAVYWMDELTGFNPLCGTPYEDIEVIGNIYEHPEMLKEPYAYNQN